VRLRAWLGRLADIRICRCERIAPTHDSACRTKGTEAYSTPIYGVLVRRQPQIFGCWSPVRGLCDRLDYALYGMLTRSPAAELAVGFSGTSIAHRDGSWEARRLWAYRCGRGVLQGFILTLLLQTPAAPAAEYAV
jgi:hypothetical protein